MPFSRIRRRHLARLGMAAAVLSVAVGGIPLATAAPNGELRIDIVSSRPDAVSGGRALVRVGVPGGVAHDEVRVLRDGTDVTASFRRDAEGLLGLVDGLTAGEHSLVAEAPRANRAHLSLAAHPGTGPVFSGPHEQPFACETQEYRTPSGASVGSPVDENCSIQTRIEYRYMSTSGRFKNLPDTATHPDDLVETTTLEGKTVPYIVRVQIGTVNRGIYEMAVLHDPATEPEPDAFARSEGWNDRLIYTLGGGCRGGWYQQGSGTGGVMVDSMLSRGFAVASNSLNVFGNNCSDLLTTETLAMTRELFIESYGEPRYTMGWGCSGGSYQAHQAADSYPGLLDGIIVGCSFPDVGFGTSQKLADARLLHQYFTGDDPGADSFTSAEQLAVSGFGVPRSVASQSNGANRLDPDAEFDASTPIAERYDAETNPGGARATVWDHTRNAYGVDADTGFARRPLDNVGVPYGLAALHDGAITVDQFLDLNEGVGGLDIDGQLVDERMTADPRARRAAYRTGRILDGGGGLATTPIIDFRAYTDELAHGDIHQRYHSFSTEQRLVEANGDAANQVMLVRDSSRGNFSSSDPVLVQAIEQMDRWISAIDADRSRVGGHKRVVRAKPADLVDACWTPGRIDSEQELSTKKIVEDIRPDAGRCHELYPTYASPRIVAGGPLASDVITCRRAAPERHDFPSMTEAQWQRLQTEVFPDGVCDYRKAGVDESGMGGTWAFFDAPGAWTFAERGR